MPVFEFKCMHGHRFEELVPIGTKAIDCPDCWMTDRQTPGGPNVRAERILSPTTTTFVHAGGRKL